MYWSWVLAIVGTVGTLLVGEKNWLGWVVLFTNECLWLAYSLTTHQYGFIFAGVMYVIVYARSIRKWRRDA